MILGTVAIVGRPNVGKSTLFNRLTHTKTAIVSDQPGVTRDRIYGTAYYDRDRNSGFTLIDTGGFETNDFKFQPFSENLVWQQTQQAIVAADLVLFMLDGKHGLHQHDEVLIRFLQQQGKKVLYLVNKIDGLEQEGHMFEFYSLGIEKLLPCSAAHSKGLTELLEQTSEQLKSCAGLHSQSDNLTGTKIALIGKPNAGKSSILNRLLGSERSLVSPIAGTTRDSLDTPFVYNQKPYILIDTAGIRRRTKISEALEVQSVLRSLRAIDRADVILLVLDAMEGMTDQDARLVNLAVDRGKPVLFIVNKWDLVPEKTGNTARDYARNITERQLKDLAYLPVHFMSCTRNQRVHEVWSKVEKLAEAAQTKVPTAQINIVMEKLLAAHSPQIMRKYSKRIKFYYATQVAVAPPTIVIMCNVSDEIQESYKRYMMKGFREHLSLDSVPIRLIFRDKQEVKARKEAREKPQMHTPVVTPQAARR